MAEVDSRMKETKQKTDWRKKCIEEFKLQPVPATLSDQVDRGSRKAWKSYFKYRSKQVKVSGWDGSDEDDDHDDYEEDYVKEAVQEWEEELKDLASEIFPKSEANPDPVKWQTHLSLKNLDLDGNCEMQSAQFHGYVYSPYAIPHAIHLQHRYHRRVRMSTMEFSVEWDYKLLDFEDADDEDFDEEDEDDEYGGFSAICSNCFEDQKLRFDVIRVSELNGYTVNHLREFLFGDVEESQSVCCDNFAFLRLLFGSMGTFGDDGSYETLNHGWIGYSWGPSDSVREKLIKEGLIGPDDYSTEISWLEHRMREVAGALRPVDAYYTAPSIKDAPGYRSPDSDDDSY
jgi:hypothetical protein